MEATTIQRLKDFVKQHRQRSLTYGEKLDILSLQATLREDNTVDVTGTIARLLGRSTRTVKLVLSEFLQSGGVTVANPPANTTTHHSRVPNTREVRALVRSYIRDRSVTRTRTVGKDVLALLQDANIITVADNAKDHVASLRAVQRFLEKQGYARGKSSNNATYQMTEEHEKARDSYVSFMVPTVLTAPRRPVVYLDESFVHHHYTRHSDSLYDPTDMTKTKPKHKGRRYYFIAGILDDGTDASQLLGLDIFVGGKKNGRTPKDYHSMFNHEYFVEWFGKLLDEVEELGWSSIVFVMDNAKYHKGKPLSTPNGSWKKADLYQASVMYELTDVSPTDLKAAIWRKVKKHIAEHVCPVVVHMARERGHHVVYTAPGFSELQPIELVWANVKGAVGRAYTSNTTFQDVYERLENAFYHLDSETIKATIDNATAKLIALDNALRQAEEAAFMVSIASGQRDGDSDTSTLRGDSTAGSSDGDVSSTSDIGDHQF